MKTLKPSSLPPSVQWISPLQYKPTPPPPPPSPPKPRSRFISHADAVHLINRQSDPQRALDIFNSAGAQPGFAHNNATYSAVLLRLARARKFTAVDALLARAALEPISFHESLLLPLLPVFARSRLPHRILHSFRLIPRLTRSPPSPKALALALDLLLSSPLPGLARSLLLSSPPTTCLLNIVLKHQCRSAEFPSAFHTLHQMRLPHSTAPPNAITYSTLMSALCHAGRLHHAFRLFEQMIEWDRVWPDPVAYNVLIHAFSKSGRPEKARAVLSFMRTNGCAPNLFNYSSVMSALCKVGKLEAARELFDEMRREGIKPDVVCYTTLVSSLCRSTRVDEGIELVKEMTCKPDTVLYNVVIEGLCRVGRVGEAMDMLEGLPYQGVRLNAASYRIVMNCLCGAGDVGRAVGLLGLMLGRGFVPHFAASNKLLVGLCEDGRVADATVALFGLAETGFKPETGSWVQLVESVCRERKLKQAFDLLDDVAMEE